ncbi:MAG: 3'-5' exonuclease, partial [Salinivenus sp.]
VLSEYGIPYTVTGSEDLGDSDELKALVDLLRAGRRPDDPVAAVAYLRGPLAGWSDEDLYRFRRAGGRFDQMADPVPDDVRAALDETRADRVEGAVERLRRARAVMRAHRPGVGTEQLVEESGLLAGAAHPDAAREASLRAGATLRIVSYVQHLGAQGLGWGEVVDELDLVLQGDESVDGMTLETGHGDAVRVMNVHQAKGLEAPVVFLADPYSSGSAPAPKMHLRREDEAMVAPVVQGEGYFERVTHAPLGWHADTDPAYQAEEERHEAAEERRLLYVAATRAERLLVVSTYPEKPNDGPWSPLYEPLKAADVPALSVPDVEPPASRTAPAPALEDSRTDRQARIDPRSRPSFAVTAVTEGASDEEGLAAEAGGSSEFGTVLHDLLEHLVRHRADPPSFDDSALRAALDRADADAGPPAVRRLRRMLSAFRESAIWAELGVAAAVHTEHPFARRDPGETGTGPEDRIQRGTIDLVYRADGPWTIIDYKSDRVGTGASREDLAAALGPDHAYRRQVRAYAAAWVALTGEPVGRAGLWFADAGVFIPVRRDAVDASR